MLSLGSADDTMDVIVIGTILQYDSVLSRLLKNLMWKRKKFKAIIDWPHRMDLWEELLLNTDDEGTTVNLFYLSNVGLITLGATVC